MEPDILKVAIILYTITRLSEKKEVWPTSIMRIEPPPNYGSYGERNYDDYPDSLF